MIDERELLRLWRKLPEEMQLDMIGQIRGYLMAVRDMGAAAAGHDDRSREPERGADRERSRKDTAVVPFRLEAARGRQKAHRRPGAIRR